MPSIEDHPPKKIGGGDATLDKVIIVDGLNYIFDKYLTASEEKQPDNENLISNYINIAYIWKAISSLRAEYKKETIIFVIKNQDGYKLSIYDDRFKRQALGKNYKKLSAYSRA